ncbi:MAG: hypothetical protein GXO35_06355, partial [Gammaproteobacteria bacterium]|nr:hypothetical protein [Gammaproteobacteria bacterium]
MLNLINNLNIRKKLALLLIMPFSSLFFFAGLNLYTQYLTHQEAKSSIEYLELTTQIADLIHSVQQERGITAGYLGSSRTNFIVQLDNQRRQTDIKLAQVSYLLSPLMHDQIVANKIKILMSFTNEREQLRLAVDSGNLQAVGQLSYTHYTKGLNLLLSLSDVLQTRINNDVIARSNESLHALLYLQEYAGQERALLNKVFFSNDVSLSELTSINTTITLQDEMLNSFYKTAAPKFSQRLKSDLASAEIQKFLDIRISAINK